jgi:dTDP-4-dehydrorhamnose 3,5-epimerase
LKIIKTKIKGVLIIQTELFKDNRGYFTESYNLKKFKKLNIKTTLQDNVSFNKKKYTFRGLHYQIKPYTQSKLIRVDQGEILDFILDLRPRSKTYLKMITIKLSEKDQKQIYITKGIAHGYLTLKPNTKIHYKVDEYYAPKHERGINIKDPKLKFSKININKFILNKKDKNLPFLDERY